MAKEAKQVLDELCTAILNSSSQDINQLVDWSRELYENLVIIQYLSNQHPSTCDVSEKNTETNLTIDSGAPPDAKSQSGSDAASNMSESPVFILHKSDEEKGSELYNEKVFLENKERKIVEKKIHVGKETISKAIYTETKQEQIKISLSESPMALNERLAATSKITLGLNDKIAFSRHLFNGNEQAMLELIDLINNAQTFEKAMNYLHQARAQYGIWEEKKDYVTRLENLVRRKFGKPEITED